MEDINYSKRDDNESIVKQKKRKDHKEFASLHDFSKSRLGTIFKSYFSLLSLPDISPVLTKPQSMVMSDTHSTLLGSKIITEKKSLLQDVNDDGIFSLTDLPFIPKNIDKDTNFVNEHLDEKKYKRDLPIGSVFQQAIKFASELVLARNNSVRGNSSNLSNTDADALTLGRDVFFSNGKNDLSTSSGKALYIHELVHVIQNEQDPQLQRDIIPLSRISMLEEEAAKIEKSFLNYLKIWGQQVDKSPKDMLSIESFVKKRLIKSFDSLNHKRELNYITYANDKAIVDSQKSAEVSSYLSLTKSSAAYAPINSGSLYEGFTNLQYRTSETNSFLPTKKTNIDRAPTPMFAESSRSINASASVYPESSSSSPVTTTTATSNSLSSSIDIERLSDQLYGMILRRIKMERDRRGIK